MESILEQADKAVALHVANELAHCSAESHQHVPIYYKNSFRCLTTLSSDNTWPWLEFLLWVMLKQMQGGAVA